MLKKLLLVLTITCMFVAVLPGAAVQRTNTNTDATTGLEYSISGGEATITGFTAPTGFSGTLNIPDTLGGAPVTKIGPSVFAYSTALTSITIPDSVTSIGNSAFYGCSSLGHTQIPSSVTHIDEEAFWGCDKMRIICELNSSAHNYAVDNEMAYIAINDEERHFLTGESLSIYYLNEDGNYEKIKHYFGRSQDSQLKYEIIFENGVQSQAFEYDSSGEVVLSANYDENGHLLDATFFTDGIKTMYVSFVNIDGNDQVEQQTSYYGDGETRLKTTYFDPDTGDRVAYELFDSNGDKTHYVTFNSDGSVDNIEYFGYRSYTARGGRR